jgi:hypothetical protein
MSYSWGVGLSSARTEGIPVIRPPIDRPPVEVRGCRPRGGPPDGADMHQLAAELAPMVDVWRRMLAQHVPDRAGRCRNCTKGGTGLPAVPWPCSLHGVADLARRRHDADLLSRDRMGNERVS